MGRSVRLKPGCSRAAPSWVGAANGASLTANLTLTAPQSFLNCAAPTGDGLPGRIVSIQQTNLNIGDLAAVNALKKVKKLPPETTKEQMTETAAQWQPYRTIATMLLWHDYLSKGAYRQKAKV